MFFSVRFKLSEVNRPSTLNPAAVPFSIPNPSSCRENHSAESEYESLCQTSVKHKQPTAADAEAHYICILSHHVRRCQSGSKTADFKLS